MEFGRERAGECMCSIWCLSLNIHLVFGADDLVSGLLISGFPTRTLASLLISLLFTVSGRFSALAILSEPNFCSCYSVASCYWPASSPEVGRGLGKASFPCMSTGPWGSASYLQESMVVSLSLLSAPVVQVSFQCFELKFMPSFAS